MRRRDFLRTTAAAVSAVALRPGTGPVDWKDWRVTGDRVNQHLTDLSRFGANPQGGVSRVAFTDADIAGRRFAMDLMRQAGLAVHIDPVGNIIGERASSARNALPILFGSHIDSVPEGGNYDGDVGSMSAIEVAQTLAERAYRNRHPLTVVIWCDEESGLTGSRGFIGDLPPAELTSPGRDGVPLADKIRRIGGDPDRLADARHAPGSIAAYVELHIEQGAILDERGLEIGIVEGIVGIHHYDVTKIGIVEGIVGIHHYDVTIHGFANHAGTTPMDRRRNALLAAAELTLAVDRIVRSVPGRQVGTVGRLLVHPGAPNVIPGQVDLTVELRIRAVIADAVAGLNLTNQLMPSGAGHDAQDLARIGPMGMIFVPSVKGISHSPLELTRPQDVTNGANVLLQTVLRLDQT